MKLIREKSCCFTGHRNIPDADGLWIRKRVRQEIKALSQQGIEIFFAGGAKGFDTFAAQEIVRLREENMPQLRLVLALPYLGQDKNWAAKDSAAYHALIRKADEVIYVSDCYKKGCYLLRDRYMVDNSAYCLCYLNRNQRRSGTAYTIRYARLQGLPVINLTSFGPWDQDSD